MRGRPGFSGYAAQAGLLVATVAATVLAAPAADWNVPALLVLGLSSALGDVVGVEMPGQRVTLSGSLLAMVVAAVLFGGAPAACIGAAAILVGWLKWREPLHMLLNNLASFMLYPLAAGLAFQWVRDGLGISPERPEWYLLVMGAFFFALVLNFLLVVGYHCWLEKVSLADKARDVLPTVFGSEALSAVLTALTAFVFHRLGTAGLTLVAVLVVSFQYLLGELLLSRERAKLLTEQTVTDDLTGLGNRRCLLSELQRAVQEGQARRLLVLFDLDGFKQYNDARGHMAGDDLLKALAERLEASVRGRGTAYRLGGDEFCVLLPAAGRGLERAVDEARRALSAEEDGLLVRPSAGSVLLPDEAGDAAAALRLADRRMYAQKDSRPASAQGQARDVLLEVLSEQQPDLHHHVSDVAVLATSLARRLGLDAADLSDVARAAELHDVGKVAIPEDVLAKPGELDAAEWDIMRRHTMIGERVLRVAPSLRRVAVYVRASHERWDGNGYPDGLAGEQIPLAARIVAVCDAFHAICTDRPYRSARSVGEALAELRSCAGTQFDPRVVDALVLEVSGRVAIASPDPAVPSALV